MNKIGLQPVGLAALIRRALDAAGYTDAPATESELRICYGEYVDALRTGLDDALYNDLDEERSVADMCRALLRYSRR